MSLETMKVDEIKNIAKENENKVNLYKVEISKGTNILGYTNSVFYDNQNKTLPVGMDTDTRILAKILDTDITLQNKKVIRVGLLEDEKDDSAKLIIKTINLLEYDVKEIEE